MSLLRAGGRTASPADQIRVCAGDRCHAETDENAPAALCTRHLREVFAYVLDTEHPELVPESAALPYWSTTAKPTGWVYFVRIGDLIKIGYTSQPARRFSTLQPSDVLHMEPGTLQDEKRCHYLFEHLRVEGEHFRPEPDLLEFIADLQKQAA